MKPDCHEVEKRISQLAKSLDVLLEPFWLRRNSVQIKVCDDISKDFDTSDYKLSSVDFCQLEKDFGPFSADFFASTFSRQFTPFSPNWRVLKQKGHMPSLSLGLNPQAVWRRRRGGA